MIIFVMFIVSASLTALIRFSALVTVTIMMECYYVNLVLTA